MEEAAVLYAKLVAAIAAVEAAKAVSVAAYESAIDVVDVVSDAYDDAYFALSREERAAHREACGIASEIKIGCLVLAFG